MSALLEHPVEVPVLPTGRWSIDSPSAVTWAHEQVHGEVVGKPRMRECPRPPAGRQSCMHSMQ